MAYFLFLSIPLVLAVLQYDVNLSDTVHLDEDGSHRYTKVFGIEVRVD